MNQRLLTDPREDQDRPCILVVEDEMILAMYVEDILIGLGCRVVVAARVAKALGLLELHAVDGAFLDVSVFGVPIDPVVRELRKRDIPFAFVTGFDPEGLPADYRTCPILTKPVVESKFAPVVADFALFAQKKRAIRERAAAVP